MPNEVKKFLIINNKALTHREIRGMYQVRYYRDEYHIEVASKDFGELKRKFLARLVEQNDNKPNRFPFISNKFHFIIFKFFKYFNAEYILFDFYINYNLLLI